MRDFVLVLLSVVLTLINVFALAHLRQERRGLYKAEFSEKYLGELNDYRSSVKLAYAVCVVSFLVSIFVLWGVSNV